MPKTPIALTPEDLELCRKLGTDPKALLAHKEKEAAKLAELDEAARFEARQILGARSPAAALASPLLSVEDLALCKALGTDPQALLREKLRLRARDEERLGKRKPTTAAEAGAPSSPGLALPPSLEAQIREAAKALGKDPASLVAEAMLAFLKSQNRAPAAKPATTRRPTTETVATASVYATTRSLTIDRDVALELQEAAESLGCSPEEAIRRLLSGFASGRPAQKRGR